MAARFKLPEEVLLAKFGNIELFRVDDQSYRADQVARIRSGAEDIFVETRKSVIGAEIMTIKQLVSSGLAQRIFVYTISEGDSHNHVWVRKGLTDPMEGTYSME